ncbi:DNA methyltransferase [Proteus sp. G2674]|uniref:DNA methyltransferase n=1 Tax=Proteus sp. G2674 TaxID=2698886 RepID=UPI0019298A2D|nr:site-specific DNA-methyltransferase [Proteus sp. G2674]
MLNIIDTLTNVLQSDERLVIDGKLAKNKIVELALNLDPSLLKLLLSDEQLKSYFFQDVYDMLIFDKVAFQRFVNNKSFLPDSYTQFKNKIGIASDTHYLSESNDVVIAWPYKDCILAGGQTKEDQKRNEIFWNEILAPEQVDTLLAPKVLINFKKYEKKAQYTDFNLVGDENLILRGNNLLALHSLKNKFRNKVKLIYIDPPYFFHAQKKEDTFQYNSNFKLSTWLTFMKNRLIVAKDLLADDGAIFVQISDDGVAELHLLMKEIFNTDQNNFINKITVRTKSPSGFGSVNPGVFETAEYIIAFAKNKSKWTYTRQYVPCSYDSNYKFYIDNVEDNPEEWIITDVADFIAKENGFDNKKEAIQELGVANFDNLIADFSIKNAHKVFRYTEIGNKAGKSLVELRDLSKKQPNKVFKFERESHYDVYVLNGREIAFYNKKVQVLDGKKTPVIQLSNIWSDIAYEGIASEGKVTLKGGKKPEKLLRRIIEMSTQEGDYVLDYHLGSGTTTAAAHKLNRRYIGIEQLNYGSNDCLVRMNNVVNGDTTGISKEVGWQNGGSFVYCELAELSSKYSNRVEQAHSSGELIAIWNELKESSNLSYKIDPKQFDKNISLFKNLSFVDQQRFLIEAIDKNQLYVNYSDIEDESNAISELDKKFNKQFYGA